MRVLIAFLISFSAWGQISRDRQAITTLFYQTSPIVWSYTAPNCARSFVIALVGRTNNNLTITGMTYGGVSSSGSGTLATSGSTGIQYFYWLSPPAGPATLSGTMSTVTGYAQAMAVTRSYCGVNQSTPIDTVASAVATGGNPGISITPTRANTWAIDAIITPTDSGYGNVNGAWGNGVANLNGFTMFSSDIGPINPAAAVTSAWNAPSRNYVKAALTLVPDTLCSITTTILPSAAVGAVYSQGIGTTHCSSPTFSLSAGALPDGMSLDSATGMITGTPTATSGGLPMNFTINVADISGNDSKGFGITVMAAAPVITSGPTCVANSPWSVKVSWITDIPSSSQVQAGTNAGGPYNTYQTTAVYTGASATPGTPGAPFGGVTSHSMVIPGLPTNASPTAYYLQVLSSVLNGGTATSNPISCGTTAPMVSTPMSVRFSPVSRYNDQYSGLHGMPNTGRAANADTFYPTAWGDDGLIYGLGNDSSGVANSGAYSSSGNLILFKSNSSGVAGLEDLALKNDMSAFGPAGQNNTNGWADGGSWKSGNCIHFYGKLVCVVTRQNGFLGGYANTSLVVSSDHGATWLAPQNWPSGTPQAGGDAPSGSGAGGVGNAMYPGGTPGNKCGVLTFAQHSQDYGGTNPSAFVNWGGADAFVYAICMDGGAHLYLKRTRIEDFLLLDTAKDQYYIGGDGLLDVNWSNSTASAAALNITPNNAGYQWVNGFEFVPDFNGYLFTHPVLNVGAPVLTAPFPWGCSIGVAGCTVNGGGYRVAGYAPRVPTHLSFWSSWATVLANTYQSLSASPLISSMTMLSNGACAGANHAQPGLDEYSPHWWEGFITPYAAGQAPRLISFNGSGGKLIAHGLRLYYTFQGDVHTQALKDWGPLQPSYTVNTGDNGSPAEDQYGAMFGLSDQGNCNHPCCDSPANNPIATGFQEPLQDFTIAVSFAHYPTGTLSGSVDTGFPLINNESVFSNGSDLILLRNGTTGNSWTVTVGATTSSPFTLPTDVAPTSNGAVTFPLLFIVRQGSTVTIYSSTGITGTPPLTPLTSFTDGTQLGAQPLVLGSTFLGIMPHLSIWNRALGDGVNDRCELCLTAQTIRSQLSNRGITIP